MHPKVDEYFLTANNAIIKIVECEVKWKPYFWRANVNIFYSREGISDNVSDRQYDLVMQIPEHMIKSLLASLQMKEPEPVRKPTI